MKSSKIIAVAFLVIGFAFQSNAQSLSGLFSSENFSNHTEFCAILFNGTPIVNADSPDGPLQMKEMAKGKIAVATIDRGSGKFIPREKIQFRVAVKDYHSNTIWMYSEEPLMELDYEALTKKLGPGDKVLFMTVDRRYRLPRHELVSGEGC